MQKIRIIGFFFGKYLKMRAPSGKKKILKTVVVGYVLIYLLIQY